MGEATLDIARVKLPFRGNLELFPDKAHKKSKVTGFIDVKVELEN